MTRTKRKVAPDKRKSALRSVLMLLETERMKAVADRRRLGWELKKICESLKLSKGRIAELNRLISHLETEIGDKK